MEQSDGKSMNASLEV